MEIDARLLGDGYLLGTISSISVVLHRTSQLTWFILIPPGDETELHDLDAETHRELFDASARIARLLKSHLAATKVNVASIGNIVPQLHLHVIGRRHDDPCWPGVVWGNLPDGPDIAEAQVRRIRSLLKAEANFLSH